jgi:D-alanyl-D-alanine carboxypeptidase (penicillin-binding protein 5/6)
MRPGRVTFVVLGLVGLMAVGAGAFAAVALTRKIPPVVVLRARLPRYFPRAATGLAWPSEGQAALEVSGMRLLRSHNAAQPQPIASVTKIMTALIILRDHPLAPSAGGPEIVVTRQDVVAYRADRKSGQSTARVARGEVLSERQALVGMLLPSANNLAVILAQWDAGSEGAFVEKMNAEAHTLSMRHTSYADASGLSALTVSTALDQIRLVTAALRVPTLAQILGLREAELPVAGAVVNLDALLGSHGITAGKTGYTSVAGGCFVFVARLHRDGRSLSAIGVVLGQPASPEHPLDAAFSAATALLSSATRQLVSLRAALRGRVVGELRSAWARPVAIRAGRVPNLLGWSGLGLRMRLILPRHLRTPLRAGQVVGALVVWVHGHRARVTVVTTRALPRPSLGWRLTHP